jgi:hypothetical protein
VEKRDAICIIHERDLRGYLHFNGKGQAFEDVLILSSISSLACSARRVKVLVLVRRRKEGEGLIGRGRWLGLGGDGWCVRGREVNIYSRTFDFLSC